MVIKNCIIDGNRRNNMSPVDCNGLIIEDNTISNSGINDGTLPKAGIDLECWRDRTAEGVLLEYGRIENVVIRNNSFVNSANGDLIFYTCNNVEVYGNDFTGGTSNVASFNIDIHDNTFTGNGTKTAVKCLNNVVVVTGEELNHNWTVSNNTITGYSIAISIGGNNQKVHTNTITNSVTGIQLLDLNIGTFHDNVITSSLANSYGHRNFTTGSTGIDVSVYNEVVNTVEYGMLIKTLNSGVSSNTGLIFDNCSFTSGRAVDMRDSDNITI